MEIDNLIKILKKVRRKRGNIEVGCGSYCGTNNAHVFFNMKEPSKPFIVDDHITGKGKLSLFIEVSDDTKEQKKQGIKDMERLGYTYYRSQFVKDGILPQSGLSPCEWHNLW